MKPESSKSAIMRLNAEQDHLKNIRKSLHVLQPAAGDKENLVGPGRLSQSMGKDNLKNNSDMCETNNEANKLIIEKLHEQTSAKRNIRKKKVHNRAVQTLNSEIALDANDLITDKPSEKYWELLAEKRREALKEALTENEHLHKKVKVLEEEKVICEKMLQEARAMLDVLKEIIAEIHPEDEPVYPATVQEESE